MMWRMTYCLLIVIAGLIFSVQSGFAQQADRHQASPELRKLHRAAEQGDAEAQYLLGMSYSAGIFGPMDRKTGLAFFRMAADQGMVDAMWRLVQLSGNGIWTDEETIKARDRIAEAAAQQKPEGALMYAYAIGRGLIDGQNSGDVNTWLNVAAIYGTLEHRIFVGEAFWEGWMVPKDPVKGYAWLAIARLQGEEALTLRLDEMERSMTVAQREQARAEFYKMLMDQTRPYL